MTTHQEPFGHLPTPTPAGQTRPATGPCSPLADPIPLAKRIAHRRSALLADHAALASAFARRQAAEGRYVKDLSETRSVMEEAGLADGVEGLQRRAWALPAMARVGGGMWDEIDQTLEAHTAVYDAYETASRALAMLREDFFLADFHVKEAIQDALTSKPIDTRLSRHGRLAARHWRTTFESTLTTRRALGYESYVCPPTRLPDAELARHLVALHEDFERWYVHRVADVVRRLEREREEARARLAFWIGRRNGLDEGWDLDPAGAEVARTLHGASGVAPPVLPIDIYCLIIRAAVSCTHLPAPFTYLGTTASRDESGRRLKLLGTFRLVHSTWRDIIGPMLLEHVSVDHQGDADQLIRRLASSSTASPALVRVLHLAPSDPRITSGHRLLSTFSLVHLHTLDGLPVPHAADPPVAFGSLSSLRHLSIHFSEQVQDSQSLERFLAGLVALKSLRVQTSRRDLHEAFPQIARLVLPQLVELQLVGFSFRGPSPAAVSPQVSALLEVHGLKLRLLLLEAVSTSEVDWAVDGRFLFGFLPQLRHLATNVPELALLFESQYTDACSLVVGHSRVDVLHDSVAAQVHFRRFLSFVRRLTGANRLLPFQMRHLLRTRSNLTSLAFWQADFSLASHRHSLDLALSAHYLAQIGLPLFDSRGVAYRDFWVRKWPVEIEAQLLVEGRADGVLEDLAEAHLPAIP